MSFLPQRKDWLIPILIGVSFGALYGVFALFNNSNFSKQRSEEITSYAGIIEPIMPYAVSILTSRASKPSLSLDKDPYLQRFQQADVRKQTSLGSGIVLNSKGDVATNAHVLNAADDILVKTQSGQLVQVSQVLIDSETDIALLRTNMSISKPLPTDSARASQVGDIVFSIGNPFGVGQSVSMGIISATGRQQPGLTQLTDFIQTDAAINPGNSGGPLIDATGRVIGMNTAIFSSTGGYQGIGFAIPISEVISVAKELSNKGRITRGYLGIDVIERPPAEKEGRDNAHLKIISVQPESPAKNAGLKEGDLLSLINGEPVKSRIQAARIISQLEPGEESILTVIRQGVELQVTVILESRDR